MPDANVIEMAGRPGTPSRRRIKLAELRIEQDIKEGERNPKHLTPWNRPGELSPDEHDIWMLLDYLEIHLFTLWAREQFKQLVEAKQTSNGTDIIPIAADGTNNKYIGMIINTQKPAPKEPDNNIDDGAIIITRLYRDPEWIGLNNQLQYTRGLEVHVFPYKKVPEEPYIIIAVQPGNMESSNRRPRPQGKITKPSKTRPCGTGL